MNQNWKQTLESRGAVLIEGKAVSFGNVDGELEAARSGSILADLSHLGALEFSGSDSQAFLNAQLSCDVGAMIVGTNACGGYCSPKGRLLADFLLWRTASAFRMILTRGIAEPIRKRLAMYVLRSKVQITDRSGELVLLGVAGTAVPQALGSLFGRLPEGSQGVLGDNSSADLIALPGGRYLIAARADAAPGIWSALAGTLTPVGTACWEWIDIRNGFPWIAAPTQDHFVPQMVNLELLGGVNFHKGCYPGQEIVARTQYLGQPKRRLFLAGASIDSLPSPGDELFSDDLPGQATGMVLNAARSPGGGVDLLAVVQVESRNSSIVHLDSPAGPVLRFHELPYATS
jgi:hypothetical protein